MQSGTPRAYIMILFSFIPIQKNKFDQLKFVITDSNTKYILNLTCGFKGADMIAF